ncbi:MAG: STAS domain-containing protein [Planctomycetota bacterium]
MCRGSGQLIGDAARAMKEELKERIALGDDVLVDLADVTFTDSEGLGALVAVFRTATAAGGRFALCAPRSNFTALLRLTRLQRVFEIYDDEASALEALGRGARA